MRFMVKVLWDVEKGNELARKGALGTTVQSILEELKPEAAYLPAESGEKIRSDFRELTPKLSEEESTSTGCS